MKVAVIGMGCCYPGAHSAVDFFENILAGRRGFREMPAERWSLDGYYHPDEKHPDTSYCKRAALVENFNFDPATFRIPKQTYAATDPAQWMALKVAQDALQDAGIIPEENKRTGVIVGNTLTGEVSRASVLRYRWPYVKTIFCELLDELHIEKSQQAYILQQVEARYKAPFPLVNEDNLAGSLSNTIAGRICNYFDFKGGGFSTDGACSSSLLAINQACIGLASGNCDIALAGGVDISIDPFEVVGFSKVGALSDSDIRVYDQYSNGFLPGEGCGMVVLQRYEDAVAQGKSIYAVINGIGISSDGKGGITAPSVSGQIYAVQQAYDMADYQFSDVELIEGHGTGTPTGDRVELTTFTESKKNSASPAEHRCGLGSIKSNIGHTKAAAGVAGFIKAVMSVCYGIKPPTQGIRQPNDIFKNSPNIYPLLRGKLWKSDARRAAVSSAGFGGINTHITLSSVEAGRSRVDAEKARHFENIMGTSQNSELVLLAADSASDLLDKIALLVAAAKRLSDAELLDVAKFCCDQHRVGRIKLAVVVEKPAELVLRLEECAGILEKSHSTSELCHMDVAKGLYLSSTPSQPRIAFMFPGQASQYLNMGARLRQRSPFAQQIWQKAETYFAERTGRSLEALVFPDVDAATPTELETLRAALNDTAVTQIAVACASLALLGFLRELGVRPDISLGHSLGEYCALYNAGVLELDDVLKLVIERGLAMAESSTEEGAMLSLQCTATAASNIIAELRRTEPGELVISNMNSPQQIILSGHKQLIDLAQNAAEKNGIEARRLAVSSAFHSTLMHNASEHMRQTLAGYTYKRPRHLVVSPSTADFIPSQCDFVTLLAEQIMLPVNFVKALETVAAEQCDVYVELGPGAVLSGLAKATLGDSAKQVYSTDIGDRGQYAQHLNKLLAYLFVSGVPLNIDKLYEGRFYRTFSLPYQVQFIGSPCEVPVPPIKLNIGEHQGLSQLAFAQAYQADTGHPVAAAETQGDAQALDTLAGILRFLKKQIVSDFGYSMDMLNDEVKLQDDLGLDSLKSVELAHEVMGAAGVKGNVAHLQNASLKKLAEHVIALKNDAQNSGESETLAEANTLHIFEPWVKAFYPMCAADPRQSAATQSAAAKMSGHRLFGRQFLLLSTAPSSEVDALGAAIRAEGAQLHSAILGQADLAVEHYSDVILLVDKTLIFNIAPVPQNVRDDTVERIKHWWDVIRQAAQTKKQVTLTQIAMNGARSWCDETVCEDAAELAWVPGTGVIKTLHLENTRIATRCVDLLGSAEIAEIQSGLIDELLACSGHASIALAADGTRYREQYELLSSRQLPPAPALLRADDVVLISGGAKGITAEVALQLARQKNLRLALLGSSAVGAEIERNLSRFAEAGIRAHYFQCNLLDAEQVHSVLKRVAHEIGPVSGLIHAAGINGLQKIENSNWDDIQRVLQPKVWGLVNLLDAINVKELKLLSVFSSVIANSGMAGNGDYAYANEWMVQILRSLKTQHPDLNIQAYGYSVWDEVGMGVRLNSIDLLANMGINAIGVAQGCAITAELIDRLWGDPNMVISSRMGQLNTLNFTSRSISPKRFLDTVLYLQPGVECISEVHLTPEKDRYLLDHEYEGSLLFPAVMGMEAMVQCAVSCREAGGKYCAEQIVSLHELEFERAIIIPKNGRNIRIYVQFNQGIDADEARVEIRSSVSDYEQSYFKAKLRWTDSSSLGTQSVATRYEHLALDPTRDLYGKILFQGPLFQNIVAYLELSSTHCVVEIKVPSGVSPFAGLAQEKTDYFGSPLVRDTFLHAVQLCVPEFKILPVSMERVQHLGYAAASSGDKKSAEQHILLFATERARSATEFLYDLKIVDYDGHVLESIDGFRCRIMGDYSDQLNLNVIHAAHRESSEKNLGALVENKHGRVF